MPVDSAVKRVAVVGAGAMGSIFGAGFTEAGYETVLVDVDPRLVEALSNGLTIVSQDGTERQVSVTATSDPDSVAPVDLAVFCVKCYHTEAAATASRAFVGPRTLVASLQNGWGNGAVLASVYAPGQIVLGVTYNSGTVLDLARIGHLGIGPTFVGAYEGAASSGAERVARVLGDGGFETTVATPVVPEIWKKLIVNAAALPAAALIGATAEQVADHELLRGLVAETTREAVAVARALGYEIDERERIDYILGLLERAGPTRGSMVQDLAAGRRTEITVINGAVVRAADELQVAVPVNRTLVALVAGWESVRGLA
jgi:2-dehydropantoate 2-reductase